MYSSPVTSLTKELHDALCRGIGDKVFSGAQASFSLEGETVHTVVAGATGWAEYKKDIQPITANTLFDIASLTKLFTTTVALTLVDEGRISLNTPIWKNFTLEALLAHETGLPAWKSFFEDIPLALRGTTEAYNRIIEQVLSTSGIEPTPDSAVYSDLGFIGLGHQLAKLTGQSLQQLVHEHVTGPLAMNHTNYAADIPEDATNIACTENCPWRHRILQGEVHDDNAWTMGGVAGHAGLFSTSEDIAKLGIAWLNATKQDGIIQKSLAQQAIQKRPAGSGLGFDLKTPGASSAGESASDRTFGHLGFTGTSLWIDPERNAAITLLTNRVHPSRDNIRIRAFRPWFHEIFWRGL